MLRVILATLGVALIAFGLFGGKSLEQVYAGLNSTFEKFSGDNSPQEVVADGSSVDSGSESIQSDNSVADSASEGTVVAVAVDSALDNEAAGNSLLQESSESEATAAVSDAVTTDSDSGQRKQSIDNEQPVVAGGSAVEKAADDTGPDSSSLKEVKASARNEELELALGTTAGEELPKEADVGEVLQTTTGSSNDVEALFVLKDLVNMRQGPSIDYPVVLRLEKGQELMEFKRDGKWVHVGAYGTSGKIGWVHERLVGKTPG